MTLMDAILQLLECLHQGPQVLFYVRSVRTDVRQELFCDRSVSYFVFPVGIVSSLDRFDRQVFALGLSQFAGLASVLRHSATELSELFGIM